MVKEGDLLWEGDDAFKRSTGVARYMDWLREKRGLDFPDYAALQAWSARDIEAFWASIWDFFEIISETPYDAVLGKREMPGAEWFPGSRVNYAEHVMRHEADDPSRTVLYHLSETRELAAMSWAELGSMTRKLATRLREMGVKPGDRIVSYMPNIPETFSAMLAVTSIGAIWSSAAPEFGVGTVADRFSQIAPKVMFAADGYRFGGKDFSRRAEIASIAAGLPSLEQVIWLDYLGSDGAPEFEGKSVTTFADMLSGEEIAREDFRYERVAHDHPLWILFSSGTTGLPKAIVSGHIGIILEHYKSAVFHLNLNENSRMFFYSTTGWVMWNTLMWGPMVGGTVVLYDGSPTYPGPDLLWKMAADTKTTSFGASPTFVENMRKHGIVPKERYDLSAIESIMLAGSPATPESFKWLYDAVKEDLWVTSQSGGTEFCCGLVGATPTQPVYAGEIQARCLGLDVRVFDDAGNELIDEVGELVVASPMPSMPLFFWNDQDFKRYKESYFDTYPGIWRHGDFAKINSRGGCFVYGRSDSTLNRFGVRIGSAEIYRALEGMDEIEDSLIVCIEEPGGGFYMPLYVQLKDGVVFDEALDKAIRKRLREERSPRHVPDEVHAVPLIPYTLTGKKMEVPVRKLLMGWPVEKAYSADAMRDPKAMDWFIDFSAKRLAAKGESMYGSLAQNA